MLQIVRYCLALGLIALLLFAADIKELGQVILGAVPHLVGAGVAAFVAMMLLDGFRLKVAFKIFRLSHLEALSIHFAGLFFSNFTPGMTGAEIYRVAAVQRLQRGLVRPITLVVLLRLIGMAVMLALTALYFALMHHRVSSELITTLRLPDPVTSVVALLLVMALALVTVAFLLRSRIAVARHSFRKLAHGIWCALCELGPWSVLAIVFISVLMTLAGSASLYFFVRAFSTAAFAPDMVVVLTLLSIGSLLPLTPGAVGVREGAIVAGLVMFGVEAPDAVAVALIHRGCFWLVSLCGGFAWLAKTGCGRQP